jgi:GxxExxY protein
MPTTELRHRELTSSILGAFYEVYSELGFGFLESVCAAALERELRARGHGVAREYAVEVLYKGIPVGFQRLDVLVDKLIVVEIKSTPMLPAFAERQLLNYLRGTNLEVGLLLHFGPKPAFTRVVSLNSQLPSPYPPSSGASV